MCGIVDCQVKNNSLPNEIQITYQLNKTPLRELVHRIHELGYESAKYCPEENNDSIKDILEKEVASYRNKFGTACIIWLPIIYLTWVVPFTDP